MALAAGTQAPWFHAQTHSRPDYAFSSVAGHYVLLAFIPEAGWRRDAALELIGRHLALFDDHNRLFYGVVRDGELFASLKAKHPGVRWFFDPDDKLAPQFRLQPEEGQWVFLDPTLRVIFSAPMEAGDRVFQFVANAKDPEQHAGVPMHAPVLIVPRIFEPALCRRLIDYYDADGGRASGVMRDIGGKTVAVLDGFKKRSDATIQDQELQALVRSRVRARLLPEMQRAFQYQATRMERYIVARYDSEEGGYFRPHRDNTTMATAHRQFACSINLNAEEFEGGDLRFAEFGRRTYRPPTGGAVVFSCSLLHEATPVTKGVRYAFLPFFYDEQRARIREENAHFLQLPDQEPVAAET